MDLEAAYCICGHCLSNRLDKNLPPTNWEKLPLPTSKFFSHSILEFYKHLSLGLSNDSRQPQVFVMPGILHWTKVNQNSFLSLLRSVWAKKNKRLIGVNFLPRSRFITIKDVDKLLTLNLLCFPKKRLSSAKKRWVIFGHPLPIDIPRIWLSRAALWISAEKPLAQRWKR